TSRSGSNGRKSRPTRSSSARSWKSCGRSTTGSTSRGARRITTHRLDGRLRLGTTQSRKRPWRPPMKALSLEAPKQFKRVEIEGPRQPGPGEALVRVHRVGICGTDISGYLGKMPFFSYPRIPGHELGVEVLDVGAGVANVRPGDRCSVEPYIN